MNTITVNQLEGLLRLEMAGFAGIIDLNTVRVTVCGADWKATLDYEAARWHPDLLLSLANTVTELKKKFMLED